MIRGTVRENAQIGRKTSSKYLGLAVSLGLALLMYFALSPPSYAQADPSCAEPANEIVAENCKAGNNASEWDVAGAGDPEIQGFATDISVNQGDTVEFKVDTAATDYKLDIYRMGYYGGDGARRVATVQPSASLPQDQLECEEEADSGLIDCGNWDVSASWDVPADAVSGIYFAKLVREDVANYYGGSHVVFMVRDDDGESDLLFQTSDTTWQAYNDYGGNSLYKGTAPFPAGRAAKVSYNRPFNTRSVDNGQDWVFNAEYPMVRWLERNGYDVSYFTDVDSDRRGAEILEHKVFLSVGHDEYWSKRQRENVEAARDAGVNLAFFSGNEIYWKTRWENSIAGPDTPYRTLVAYKEGNQGEGEFTCGGKCDPEPNTWTGLWRTGGDYDAGLPENALSGQISWVDFRSHIEVPADYGGLRFWRDTSIADLGPDDPPTNLTNGTLGYEWDYEQEKYASSNPDGRITMSETTRDIAEGDRTHKLSLYKDDSGALVFGAGTVQWSWGLDENHDLGSDDPDPRMQQATVNLFADMGVQPGNLQSDLQPATASDDETAPTSAIISPEDGDTVEEGEPYTITGTATDGETGGVIGGVEVSVDGGKNWLPAEGGEQWRYTWTPEAEGQVNIRSRAIDDSGNLESAGSGIDVTVGPQEPATCPCSIWDDAETPIVQNENDTQAVELGVRFRSDTGGFITGVRFYKGDKNTGIHVGHLWTNDGEQLAEATFTGETASAWQEVRFDQPVEITADTTYVASYHSTVGYYSADSSYFASGGKNNPPLRALADGADGANGVYRYGASGFPTETFGATNYWVDVVFETSVGPDTTPPTVRSVAPTDGATGVSTSANVTAAFDEAMDAATIDENTFELRDAADNVVPASITYAAASRTAVLDPDAALQNSETYSVTVSGGVDGVKDASGNALAQDKSWTFTTAAPPPPPPDEGPGGPIAVIGSAENPFGRYYAEILRNEGFNAFTATDISNVNAATLAEYDTVILGEMPLTADQVSVFTDWVGAGGNLIAMRPDPKLAELLGLTNASGTLANEYLRVDTATSPGKGIVGQTIQFHGTADRYSLGGGTREVATLYSDATTATQNPAVTLRDVGANGGQAAAFTYDLARSVVYTRQGNPAWEGQNRDVADSGDPGIRSNDMFYGAKAGDVQPDWINLDKVQIPQADEQQRLLANMIGQMNLDKKPLPRFWYFPRAEEAIIIMTGDDHAGGQTDQYFDYFKQQSPQGCSVADWECVRGTSYIFPNTPLTDAKAKAYQDEGFEVAVHVNTGCTTAWTPENLEGYYRNDISQFQANFPSLDLPTTNRTHCIAWSDWATQPKVNLRLDQEQDGKSFEQIRLDTNYYYYPGPWIKGRAGMFTGSGMSMRFADKDGSMIDVYQSATQLIDEWGYAPAPLAQTLIDNAIGGSNQQSGDGTIAPQGYYGAFNANMHTDRPQNLNNNDYVKGIVQYAQQHGVPVITAKQMLQWLDARNNSSFEDLSWDADTDELSFTIAANPAARGLQAMVPARSDTGPITGLTRDGALVNISRKTVKGVEYAFFPSSAGDYVATYGADQPDTTPPVISEVEAVPAADGTATISWSTDEPSTSRVEYGTSPDALDQSASDGALVGSHGLRLTGLEPGTTYRFRVTSADAEGNSATSPPEGDAPASFETPSLGATDTTVADFSAGAPGADTYVSDVDDGEVILRPEVGAEFSGSSLPSGWESTPWTGGAATVSGGVLSVDGARANTSALYDPGHTLECVATFGGEQFQNVGFGQTLDDAPWAMFSTGGGALPVGFYARTNGPQATNTPVTGVDPREPHRYRIEWNASNVVFFVDGAQVASHPVTISAQMRPLASDYNNGGTGVKVEWMRMSPYAPSGTFQSRVLDSGQSGTDWISQNSTTRTPSGTAVAFETRSGDSATPGGSWSGWEAVGSGGAISSPGGRYVQYRATLTTNDDLISPTIEQVILGYGGGGPDTEPPAISGVEAVPAADGTATISWSTDEPSTSRVEYGTSPDALDQSASDGALVGSHGLRLTGLEPGTTYRFRVTSADAEGNSATSPPEGDAPASFETPSLGATDTTVADFSAGAPGADTYVSDVDDGEVILRPEVGAEFSGSGLPGGWTVQNEWQTGGAATVSGGALSVDGASVSTDTAYGPGRSLEFEATFGAASFQTVGFATDLSDIAGNSWVQFGTANSNNTLSARINNNGTVVPDFVIPDSGSLIGTEHTYRIEWTNDEIRFFVDGELVRSETVTVNAQMRPVVSDFNLGGSNPSVDWLRMSPNASPGTFESRVFDSGQSGTEWNSLSSITRTPVGTGVAFETRSGDSATPGGSWSGWEAVGSGGAISSPGGRYAQYRADLSTDDDSISPTIEQVTLFYRRDAQAPAAPSEPDLAAQSDSGSSDNDDVTNDDTPTLTGTAEPDTTVELFADGDSLGEADTNGQGDWSFTISDGQALDDGTYSITARATDSAGNVSPASEALSVTIDTEKPGAPTEIDLIPASDTGESDTDDVTGDNTPAFDVTAEPDSTVRIYKGEDPSPLGSATADGSGVARVISDQLADGNYSITATAEDAAGNVSDSSATISVLVDSTIDTETPAAPSRPDLAAGSDTGSSDNDDVTRDTTPTFTGSAEAGSTVSVYEGQNVLGETDADGQGDWSFIVPDGQALTGGTYSITATSEDAAGNVSDPSDALSLVVDRTAPTVETETPADQATDVDVGTDITATFSEDMDPTTISGSTFKHKEQDGPDLVGATVSYDAANRTATLDPNPDLKLETTYVVTLTGGEDGVKDAAGNPLAVDEIWTFTTAPPSDTTPPDKPTVRLDPESDSGPSDTDSITNDNTPTFDGAAEAGSTVEIVLNDGSIVTGSVTADMSGSYTFTIADQDQLPDGTYTVTAKATDDAGNVSDESDPVTLTVDTIRPATPAIVSPQNGSQIDDGNITVSGTAEGETNVRLLEGTEPIGATEVSPDGTWSIQLDGVADGEHAYSARAADAAGNVSEESGVTRVTVDTGAPTVTIDSGPSGTVDSDEATFTFSADEQANFECSLDANPFERCSSPQAYTSLPNGPHDFTVRARDAAGNISPPDERTWTVEVDREAPTVIGTAPESQAADVAVSTDVTATFSEDVLPGTVDENTFKLSVSGADNPVPAIVSYDAASRTATLDPNAALKNAETYVATVVGGEAGVKDSAGNDLAADKIWTFTTVAGDAQAPTVTIDEQPPTFTNNPRPTFRFSADEPNSTFECSLTTSEADFVACTSPKEYEPQADGAYHFRVRARDAAGNRGDATSYNFTIDTRISTPTRPDLAAGSDTGSSDTDDLTRDPTPTFTGSAEAGSTVRVDEGQNLLRQMTTNNAGTWKFTVAGDQQLADGTYSITAMATDKAGNASPRSKALSITIDRKKPTIAPNNPEPGSRINGRTPTVKATIQGEPNGIPKSNIGVFLDNQRKNNFSYDPDNRRISYKSTTLSYATHSVRIEATDKAGNQGVRQWNFQVVR